MMRQFIFAFITAFIALLGIFSAQPSLASHSPEIQIVQSVPTETGLALPDLPFTQQVWTRMIRSAHSSIDLAQFYLYAKGDPALEPVLKALEGAGKRGVRIRVLLSPILLKEDPAVIKRIRAIPHATIRLFDIRKLTHGILHAKYFVIDRKVVFVGSQNFDWRALTQIHETGLLVRSKPIAKQLSRIFDADWELAKTGQPAKGIGTKPATRSSGAEIELAASPPRLNPPGIRPGIQALTDLISHARSSLKITVMSYSLIDKYDPSYRGRKWTKIDAALRSAARRGVRVQMMVSDWSVEKPAIDELKSLARVPNVHIKIVSIPQSKRGYIKYARVVHSKFMVVDGKILWVGTSNWERDYFSATRDIDMIVRSPKLAKTGNRIFVKLWESRFASPLVQSKTYVPRKRN